MELPTVSDFQMHKPENTDLNLVMQSAIQTTVQEWQLEIIFLKNNFSLLKKLMERSHFSNKCFSPINENLEKELSLLVNRDFQLIESKIEKLLGKWQSNNFLEEASFETSFTEFRMLRQEWLELKHKQQQLEIQILEGLIQNYPVRIF